MTESENVKRCIPGVSWCLRSLARDMKVGTCCSLTYCRCLPESRHIRGSPGAFTASCKLGSILILFTGRIGWFCGKLRPQGVHSVQESAWMPVLVAPSSHISKQNQKKTPSPPLFPGFHTEPPSF